MTPDIQLIFRLVKGSPLTAAEVDQNFSKIRDAIISVAQQYNFRLVLGDEPPAGERVGVLWIPSDYRGAYVWDATAGKWERVREPKLYAVATNVGNAFTISIPGDYTSINDLIGRVVAFTSSGNNTGAATLVVNAYTARPIKKNGTEDLIADDIKSGVTYLTVYDGTAFQLLNPSPHPVQAPVCWTSDAFDIPAFAHPVKIAHPFTKQPEMVRLVLVCKALGSGYAIGDEMDARSVTADRNAGDEDDSAFTLVALKDENKFQIGTFECDHGFVYVASDGSIPRLGYPEMSAKWSMKIVAMAFP